LNFEVVRNRVKFCIFLAHDFLEEGPQTFKPNF